MLSKVTLQPDASDFRTFRSSVDALSSYSPELAASIAAALKKNTSMALGNVVGSNIFNIALILGLSSQVTPLTSTGITMVDYIVMIAAVVALYAFGRDCKIQRYEGVILFLCFIGYTWYLITNQIA